MAASNVNEAIIDIPSHRLSFDTSAFDEAIQSQGVRLVHYQALSCPVGKTDLNDNRRPHDDHENCTNGFLYLKAGVITALFTGNSKRKDQSDPGFWDGSTVQVTFPRTYEDPAGEEFFVAPFDRFYLEEQAILVPTWEQFLHHESGQDRLKFPPVKVQVLIDASGQKYTQDVDFKTLDSQTKGQITWTGRRPAPQLDVGPIPSSDRGAVCSVRYLYRPYWYVGQIVHEIRVSQVTGPEGRVLERMPQAVVLHREYLSLTKDQNPPENNTSADILRSVLGPMNGGFGPK